MGVLKITDENFKDFIKNDGVILIDFWATWCGPCRMIAPVLEEIHEKTKRIIGKVNIDENEELVKAFSIHSIPTLLAFKDGRVIGRAEGFMPYDALNNWLNGLEK